MSNRIITFEVPWYSRPFVPQRFNITDQIDQRLERFRPWFPNLKVTHREEQPQKWIHGENMYLNCVVVTVDLGESYDLQEIAK